MNPTTSQTPGNTPGPRRSLRRRIWAALPSTLLFLGLVIVIVLLYGQIKLRGETIKERKASELKTDRPPVNVVVQQLTPAPISERINLPGTVQPWIDLTVVAEVRGKVVDKHVTDGQAIEKGDLIARLDDRDYRNAYDSAKAAYETAAAALKRLKALSADQLATQSQLDEAVARMHAQKAAMDNAALNLERCEIRAPLSGIVNHVYIEDGQYLNAADPVADVLQINRVKVMVGIPESDVDAVRRLTRFDISIDALAGRRFVGERDHLSRTADSTARLYNLYLKVENPDREILPDMFARVEIVKKRIDDGLSVPLYALINRSQGQRVFIVEDGKAVSRPVELGLQDGWRIQIAKGLSPNDRVIVVGHRGVNDGQPVSVVRTVNDLRELMQ